jgi:hypothetical protein
VKTHYTQEATTINKDIVFPTLHDEAEKLDILKPFPQNVKTRSGFGTTIAVIFGSAIFLLGESGTSSIPEPRAQDTNATLELNFGEEIESGVTQEFAGIQPQVPAFPFYNEEDILNLDAVIDTPPPRLSRTIRVKLIYEEPSEPIPVEDPWE